jgi:hypothetical protein
MVITDGTVDAAATEGCLKGVDVIAGTPTAAVQLPAADNGDGGSSVPDCPLANIVGLSPFIVGVSFGP